MYYIGLDVHKKTIIRICWICGRQVPLETCNIDEYGEAVHEICDVARLTLDSYTASPKKLQSQAKSTEWRNSFSAST
jgi:hypothetical protein